MTSLARQLEQLAASSRASLNTKAQRASHSRSLLWPPAVAASQTYDAVYAVCVSDGSSSGGFEELCRLDARFTQYRSTLFDSRAIGQDRSQMSKDENESLDGLVVQFLRAVGGRVRLLPAIKAVEWLVRRFR